MPKPLKPKQDTHRYKGWLNSDSFWKRAFAIYGYSFAAGIAILLPIYIIIGIIVIVFTGADDDLENALDSETEQVETYYEE